MSDKQQQTRTRPQRMAERLPGTGTERDAPHVSRAVRGCGCLGCTIHRRLVHSDDPGPGVWVG